MIDRLPVNFDLAGDKQSLYAEMRKLRGEWLVSIAKPRKKPSSRQRGFYYAVMIPAFIQFLADQGETTNTVGAHEMLKHELNPHMIVSPKTGALRAVGGSTADSAMNLKEYNAYLDRVAAFLANFCGIAVPEPSVYHLTAPREPTESEKAEIQRQEREGK